MKWGFCEAFHVLGAIVNCVCALRKFNVWRVYLLRFLLAYDVRRGIFEVVLKYGIVARFIVIDSKVVCCIISVLCRNFILKLLKCHRLSKKTFHSYFEKLHKFKIIIYFALVQSSFGKREVFQNIILY